MMSADRLAIKENKMLQIASNCLACLCNLCVLYSPAILASGQENETSTQVIYTPSFSLGLNEDYKEKANTSNKMGPPINNMIKLGTAEIWSQPAQSKEKYSHDTLVVESGLKP